MSSHKKITKVPNGPLIKKKGQFKGSTLKTGGKLKKAQGGEYITKENDLYSSIRRVNTKKGPRYYEDKSPDLSFARALAFRKQFTNPADSIPKAKLPKRALEVMNQKNGGKVKKAQTGGTYYASSNGRVGRISSSKIGDNISAVQNESIDTTGYAKGKKDFTKTINKTFEKPSSKIVKRADVPKVISNLKKGATRKMDLRTLDQRKKSKMKDGGMVKQAKSGSKVNEAGNYTKPGMRKSLFNSIKAGSKGGNPGQWSARKAQLLAKKYKASGGGYKN